MNTLIVIIVLFFIFLLGFSILHLLNAFEKRSLERNLLFSFGVGVGVVMIQMYIYSRLGIEWSAINIFVPWAVFYFFAVLRGAKGGYFVPRIAFVHTKSKIAIFLCALIALLLIFTTLESTLRPLNAWDGYASWLFRSKMYFIEGSIDPILVKYLPTEYPPLVSLLGTLLYTFLGEVDDRSILITYAVFYISLGSLFFYSIREKTGNVMALFFTFLLLSTQNLIRHSGRFEAGQADVILGYFLFVSFLLFLNLIKEKTIKNLGLLHFFLLISALIKNDGVPLILLAEFILFVVTIYWFGFKKLIVSLIFIIPFADWQYFKFLEKAIAVPEYLSSSIYPKRFGVIVKEFFKELTNFQNWNMMWLTVFISFFALKSKRINSDVVVPLAIVSLYLVILGSVFFITTPNPQDHIPNVLNRALLHIAPIGMYAVSIFWTLLKLKLKNEK